MKTWTALLLVGLTGAVRASSPNAQVYILPQPDLASSWNIPTVTEAEAKLIISQRLGVAAAVALDGASSDTLEYITRFAGEPASLFSSSSRTDDSARLVVLLQDTDDHRLETGLSSKLGKAQPSFNIKDVTSKGFEFLDQLPVSQSQYACNLLDEINPLVRRCWSSESKVLAVREQSDVDAFLSAVSVIQQLVADDILDVVLVLVPKGKLGKPRLATQSDKVRRFDLEEPIELEDVTSASSEVHSSKKNGSTSLRPGAFASCYKSKDACEKGTNNCSGHGSCYAKIKSDSPSASCYTCRCETEVLDGKSGRKVFHYGGRACQKQDVSSQFWLLLVVSIFLIGIVSAGIGMLFGIGEEKLPGVIGAGVSGARAR